MGLLAVPLPAPAAKVFNAAAYARVAVVAVVNSTSMLGLRICCWFLCQMVILKKANKGKFCVG